MPKLFWILLLFALLPVFSGCGDKGSGNSLLGAPGRWFGNMKKRDREMREREQESAEVEVRTNRSSNHQKALELMRQRRFQDALPCLDEALEANRNSVELHTLRGDCLYQLLRFEESILAYEHARKLDPDYYPARRGLGFVYLNMGNNHLKEGRSQEAFGSYTKSLGILRECAEILPSDARAAYGRAYAAGGLAKFYKERAINLRARSDLQGAETMFDKCAGFIKEAVTSARFYQQAAPAETAPRIAIARLFRQLALLEYEFERYRPAILHLDLSRQAWQSILDHIDKNHQLARTEVDRTAVMLGRWRAEHAAVGNMP